jgi:hypothetical protein
MVILHLEPTKRGVLYQDLVKFMNVSAWTHGFTDANAYHPHCSMTGYWETKAGEYFSDEIGKAIQDEMEKFRSMKFPPPIITDITLNSSVRLHLETHPVYADLIERIKGIFPTENIRKKKLDHISLAYFRESATKVPPEEKMTLMHKTFLLATRFLGNLYDFPIRRPNWDIVYYKLEQRAAASLEGDKHDLTELARWRVA